jgi:hypothetical protein
MFACFKKILLSYKLALFEAVRFIVNGNEKKFTNKNTG